jgi:hypothetical protein
MYPYQSVDAVTPIRDRARIPLLSAGIVALVDAIAGRTATQLERRPYPHRHRCFQAREGFGCVTVLEKVRGVAWVDEGSAAGRLRASRCRSRLCGCFRRDRDGGGKLTVWLTRVWDGAAAERGQSEAGGDVGGGGVAEDGCTGEAVRGGVGEGEGWPGGRG